MGLIKSLISVIIVIQGVKMTFPDLSGLAPILQSILAGLLFSSALIIAILVQDQRIIKRLDRLISITSKEDEIKKVLKGPKDRKEISTAISRAIKRNKKYGKGRNE